MHAYVFYLPQAREITTLAEKKLRQAEMALSRSKYELGTALQQAQKMRLEQEEAEVLKLPYGILWGIEAMCFPCQ